MVPRDRIELSTRAFSAARTDVRLRLQRSANVFAPRPGAANVHHRSPPSKGEGVKPRCDLRKADVSRRPLADAFRVNAQLPLVTGRSCGHPLTGPAGTTTTACEGSAAEAQREPDRRIRLCIAALSRRRPPSTRRRLQQLPPRGSPAAAAPCPSLHPTPALSRRPRLPCDHISSTPSR
jgi:hypothetical protein